MRRAWRCAWTALGCAAVLWLAAQARLAAQENQQVNQQENQQGQGVVEGQPLQDEPQQDQSPGEAAPAAPAPLVDRTLATLHGVVRNAVTGDGVPRALVRVEGDANTGVLTDGDGRFEISGVAVGPQSVSVSRPGFFNPAYGENAEARPGDPGPPHNVLVAAAMADVEFTLAPTGAIRGRLDLSTGDPADGINVALLKRVVQDGRAQWQSAGTTQTRSDGTYRFGGLADGEYEVFTMPALDSDSLALLVAPGKGGAAERWGYASLYYPGAREPSGAQAIRLAHGAEAEANFLLTREPFETVTASVVMPQPGAAKAMMSCSAQVMDGAGHELNYVAQYDQAAHTVQAALPEGNYSMLVAAAGFPVSLNGGMRTLNFLPSLWMGELDFAVAERPVTGLRVALSAPASAPVDVTVNRSGTTPAGAGQVAVMVSPAAAGTSGALVSQYAGGPADGPLQGTLVQPGTYWLHTYVSGGLCESSFTAGGANLAREPLTIGLSGVTVPLELTLRDDCAHLTLSLPESAMTLAAGDERFYTAYAVPDFDFTRDLSPVVLRPSVSGTATLNDLTPGNYHVYTFAGDVRLEYRNRAALGALSTPGQAVTLGPGATDTLVLEAPEP
jgi:Carboxypeptidase regulatory-like domain